MADIGTQFPGQYVYLDVAVQSVSFTIYVNGLQDSITASSLSNCSYNLLSPLLEGTYINNITIYVSGPLMSGRDVGSTNVNWSFQFNSFMYVSCFFPVAKVLRLFLLPIVLDSQLALRAPLRVPLQRLGNLRMLPPGIINHKRL